MIRQGFSPVQAPFKQTPVLFGAVAGGVGMQTSNSLLATATAALNGIAPYHYWDFTTNRALFAQKDVGAVTSTPNWSFSRASTGYANQTPNVNFGTTNLILQSQTLDTSPWVSFQSSITANATAAPDGTTTADKLVEDTSTNTHTRAQTVTLTASVQTFSIYAKAAERTRFLIFVPTNAFADVTARTVVFDLTGSGSTSGLSGAGATASIEVLANGWYRCILNVPATLAVGALIQYGLINEVGVNNYTGNGTSGLFLWGAQIEPRATVSAYKPTTTVAVTDLSGPPLVSFGINVPRLTNKGLLVEDLRTNVLLQSQTMATAPWSPFQSSVTADATAAPDGTITADKLVEDTTAASTHFHQQIVNLTASVQTFSIYAKAAERTQTSIFVPTGAFADAAFRTASFNLTGAGSIFGLAGAGAAASIEALAGGWYRCILNVPATLAVAANIQYGMLVANNPVYTGNGTSGLFLWGAQVEAAATHSSYITTTTVTATRQADVANVSSPGVAYPLSLFVEFTRAVDTGLGAECYFNVDAGGNDRFRLNINSSDQGASFANAGGVTQFSDQVAGAIALDTVTKIAARVAANDARMARGGTLGTLDNTVTVPAAPTAIVFGADAGGNFGFGYVRRAAIFNTALIDATLQRVTA